MRPSRTTKQRIAHGMSHIRRVKSRKLRKKMAQELAKEQIKEARAWCKCIDCGKIYLVHASNPKYKCGCGGSIDVSKVARQILKPFKSLRI